MTRKVQLAFLLFAAAPFLLWCLPQTQRLYGHLLGTPVLWGLISVFFLSSKGPGSALLGQRRIWPFVWIPGLVLLCLGFLGVGYAWNLVVFSYGVSNQPISVPLALPVSLALLVIMTFGVEQPLRQKILGDILLRRGVGTGISLGIAASLGVLRSLPFYWTPWIDPQFFVFALLALFLREITLCRLYIVSGNVLACGVYHTTMILIEAFIMSDVLGPYSPTFHWISSNVGFYYLVSLFHLLPLLVLSCIPAARRP